MTELRSQWLLAFISLVLIVVFSMTGIFGIFYDTALASFLLLVILCIPFLFKNFRWYEPVCAMNAMFSLLGIAGVYLAYTGFSTAEHAIHEFRDLTWRAPLTILYVISWILCFYVGYYLFRKVPVDIDENEAIVQPLKGRQAKLIRAFSLLCFSVAFFNVAYNVWLFNPENPVAYFSSFGVSKYRNQVNDGYYTTLGYNLFIVGLIFYRYSFGTWSRLKIVVFFLLLSFALIAVLSRGQIFFTFSIVLFLFVLEYFFSRNRNHYFRWALGVLPLLCVVIVISYFLRLVSVEFFLAQKIGEEFNVIQSFLSKVAGFGALIFGKGNVPNLPAMMVYEDHFGSIESYLWGESLIGWLSAFLPFFDATYIGYGISDAWYPNNVGGIPPGVVHEMVANFGFFGASLFAISFGAVSACAFNMFVARRGFIFCVLYSALLVRLWFILPKVEFAVLSNAIWLFLPTLVVFVGWVFVGRVFLFFKSTIK